MEYPQDIHGITATGHSTCFVGHFSHLTVNNYKPVTFEKRLRKCRESLFINHPDIDEQSLAREKGERAPDTCTWVLDNPHYQDWLAKKSPLLWISGGPGRGKTVISLFLAENLRKMCIDRKSHLLLYFCRFDNDLYNSNINLLRSLAYQLLHNMPTPEGPEITKVLQYFETVEKTQRSLADFDCLWTVFELLLSQPSLPTVFCIIDGVDECHGNAELIKKFRRYYDRSTYPHNYVKLRLAIIGRDADRLTQFDGIKLDPDNEESVHGDVENFIKCSLDPIERIFPGFKENRLKVEKSLLKRAEGTFLWVSFVIHELFTDVNKKTLIQIEDDLRSMPQGLYPIFARMLKQIDPHQVQTSITILQWVAMAETPLRLGDLADIIKEPDMNRMEQRIEICQPMLRIQSENKVPGDRVQNLKVIFVHQSAKEYLLRNEKDPDPILERFRIIPDQGHGMVAHRCLQVLEDSLSSGSNIQQRKTVIHSYALHYWKNHLKLSSVDAKDLFNLKRPFFQENLSYIRRGSIINPWRLPLLPVHLASYLAIIPWLKAEKDWRATNESVGDQARRWREKVNVLSGKRPPLTWAIEGKGDKATIRFLLDHGASTETRCSGGKTALFEAVSQGDLPTIRILFEYDANFNAKDMLDRTPLMVAAGKGDCQTAKLLLECGASVHAQDQNKWTALMYGAWDKDTLRLLLISGADVEATNETGMTALIMAAASVGRKDIVQNLLEKGADVEAKDHSGGTALMKAAAQGDLSIVKDLLNKNAKMEARDGLNETALMKAVRNGHITVPRFLISHTVETGQARTSNSPIVFYAARYGDMHNLDLLLQRGADANKADDGDTTALYLAILRTDEAMLRLLLERGANPNQKCRDGTTPLIAAILKGRRCPDSMFGELGDLRKRQKLVALLIDHAANVNIYGRIPEGYALGAEYASPLICAASIGWDWVVRLLLQRGANCDLLGSTVDQPVPAIPPAMETIWEPSAKLSLTPSGDSALIHAARQGFWSTVCLLLLYRADKEVKGKDGKTALELATEKGFEDVQELLSKKRRLADLHWPEEYVMNRERKRSKLGAK